MRRLAWAVLAGTATVSLAANATTLDDVKKRGFVNCGLPSSLAGFASANDAGELAGFDVDYCRAIAAAVLNNPKAVRLTALSATARFTALQSGQVDVLIHNTSWTMARDTSLGLGFVGVNFFDGQGFLVPKSFGVTSALELSGASICVLAGTSAEQNLADFFKAQNMKFTAVVLDRQEDILTAYAGGRCTAVSADASGLYPLRLATARADDHQVLPEIISKEPWGPSTRQGDAQWTSIVKWVHFALLNAEELGVTAENAERQKTTPDNTDIKRLLGGDGKFGEMVGLSNDWAYNVVRAVGNYGQIFDRNLGAASKLKMPRGQNALWSKGGLQFAPAVR
ncbi:MAG: amino acid ABC transporter substrate-binding protein [Bauldia sp.]